MLQSQTGEQLRRNMLWVIACDAKDDKIQRICFCRIKIVQKPFRRRDLQFARLLRRESHLPRQRRDAVDAELGHWSNYPAVIRIGQGKSFR